MIAEAWACLPVTPLGGVGAVIVTAGAAIYPSTGAASANCEMPPVEIACAPVPAPPSAIETDPAKVVYPVPRLIVLTPPFVPKVTEAAVKPPSLRAIIGALV